MEYKYYHSFHFVEDYNWSCLIADEHTDSFHSDCHHNARWKVRTMTWFILLKTLVGHGQLHTRTMTPSIWLETIEGWLTVVNTTTATK